MPSRDEVQEALLDQIAQVLRSPSATETVKADAALRLAEAWAWLETPSQPHGGTPRSVR